MSGGYGSSDQAPQSEAPKNGPPPVHQVWGDPEVLSCYSHSGLTSDEDDSGSGRGLPRISSRSRRSLPEDLAEHLESGVTRECESASNSESISGSMCTSSDPSPAAAASVDAVQVSAHAQAEQLARQIEKLQIQEASQFPVAASSSAFGGRNPISPSEKAPVKGMPSVGTRLHATGNCKPCLYLNSASGCTNGANCGFCHMPHNKRNRIRPSKHTRMQCKQIVAFMDVGSAGVEERLAAHSPYMATLLRGKLKGQAESAKRVGAAASSGGNAVEHGSLNPDGKLSL